MKKNTFFKQFGSLTRVCHRQTNVPLGIIAFVAVIGFSMVFLSCASNIPITPNIISEVGGVENTPQFQYYVSKTINLERIAGANETKIEGGQLIRKSSTARDKITIPENLPGIVLTYAPREPGGYALGVSFEDVEGDPIIAFGQYRKGNEQRYFILYDDPKNHIIQYGDARYVVHYEDDDDEDDDEYPCLLIKMQQSSSETSKARKASGRKLGQ